MARGLGMYDHLDKTDPPVVPLTMPDLVALVRKSNYGEHRFLSELVRQREASDAEKLYPEHRAHTAMLRALLERGYY